MGGFNQIIGQYNASFGDSAQMMNDSRAVAWLCIHAGFNRVPSHINSLDVQSCYAGWWRKCENFELA